MKKYLSVLTLVATSVCAQILSMQTCIDKTLASHPDIKGFILEVSKSEQNTISVRSAYLPHINLEAEYDAQQTYALPQNGQFNTIEQSGWHMGVVAKQKIWDFGKTTSQIALAKLDKEIGQLSLQEAKKLIVYKVQFLYLSALVYKESILVHQKDVQTKKELYEQAVAFVAQGLKTTSDATRFLSSYYGAKDAVGVSESSYKKALLSLSLYMAQPIVPETEFEKNLMQDSDTLKNRSDELSEKLLTNNTQLKIYDKTILKNHLQREVASAGHFGSIDAVASYMHFDTLNAYDTSMAGLTLNIPVYSGLEISAQTQMARIATNVAKESKASKVLALQEELNGLLIDLEAYKNTIEAKQSQLEASLSTKKVLNARYKEGLATYIEVLDATALYLRSELGLLEVHFNQAMAQNRIHYLTGAQK